MINASRPRSRPFNFCFAFCSSGRHALSRTLGSSPARLVIYPNTVMLELWQMAGRKGRKKATGMTMLSGWGSKSTWERESLFVFTVWTWGFCVFLLHARVEDMGKGQACGCTYHDGVSTKACVHIPICRWSIPGLGRSIWTLVFLGALAGMRTLH